MTTTTASPDALGAPAGTRIQSLDVLRAFALLGMFVVHLNYFSGEAGVLGALLADAIVLLVETKSHGTFALLFGAGFAVQLRSLERRGAPVVAIYLRRLLLLACFGIAAEALFGYRVLLAYAIWGVPLLLVRHWSPRGLLAFALFCAVAPALFGMVQEWYWQATMSEQEIAANLAAFHEGRVAVAAAAEQARAADSYAALVAAQARRIVWFYSIPNRWIPGHNLALFLVGMLAVRTGVIEQPLRHRRILSGAAVFGALAFGCAYALRTIDASTLSAGGAATMRIGTFLLSEQWLAFTYVAALLAMMQAWPRSMRLLAPFGWAGRMALTNYFVQIALLSWIGSGYGLGITTLHPVVAFGCALLLFAAQISVSRWWLARYRYGPLEWAWRVGTYGRMQPLRIADAERARVLQSA